MNTNVAYNFYIWFYNLKLNYFTFPDEWSPFHMIRYTTTQDKNNVPTSSHCILPKPLAKPTIKTPSSPVKGWFFWSTRCLKFIYVIIRGGWICGTCNKWRYKKTYSQNSSTGVVVLLCLWNSSTVWLEIVIWFAVSLSDPSKHVGWLQLRPSLKNILFKNWDQW